MFLFLDFTASLMPYMCASAIWFANSNGLRAENSTPYVLSWQNQTAGRCVGILGCHMRLVFLVIQLHLLKLRE